ncbi:helix-turn-helix domain-containing protein [Staphylococcus argenteus]|uniref:helix-turn-helix domain-containing protein n=1 Tax=Staphylococcus argenteus TaxID=985002 RepID=UPI0021BD35E9|nr:helix-turn-helix transcriptional regulator [Staphylococcus argenteus]
MKLAEAIKEQRELKGWSQEELANILKVSRQSVSKWESAKNYPSLDILIAMSDLFGISLEHLIKGDARFKKVILEGNYRESNRVSFLRYFDCYERFIRNLFRAFN